MRLAAGLEYEGTAYAGWQAQNHAQGVQNLVEQALSRIADRPVSTVCAGRTDAGVHALGQVIHFDVGVERPLDAWLLGSNSHLPSDISLRWVRAVPPDFHARHSARARRYRYLIHNSRSRSGLYAHRAAWCTHPLDAQRMHAAAQSLLGEHDFSAYRAAECQSRSPNRNVLEITVARQGEWLSIEVEANAFLHHMVRNIAGVLIAIGRGDQPGDWARQVLEGRDRRLGGVTAAPEGLYFLAARYDAAFGLPPHAPCGFAPLP
jgi:tRNA pseudouridine38-40 synthase